MNLISQMWPTHITSFWVDCCLKRCAPGHPSQGMAANPYHPANPAPLRRTINLIRVCGSQILAACLMRILHMQVADAAQKCIGVKCFKKEHYPLPDQAAAAFSAASEQVWHRV